MLDSLDAFELIETSADHVRRARQVQRLLAAKHQRGRKVPDLLIAAAAEELRQLARDRFLAGEVPAAQMLAMV